MAVILKTIFGKDKKIREATSYYIDDILIDESIVTVE